MNSLPPNIEDEPLELEDVPGITKKKPPESFVEPDIRPLAQKLSPDEINYRRKKVPSAELSASRQKIAVRAAAIIFLLILLEIGATIYQHYRIPADGDWSKAAEKLRELRKSGEPVLFAPAWVDPLGRYHFGDQIEFPLVMLSDVETFGRVFEISIRGQRHPWLKNLTPAQSYDFGPVSLKLFTKAAKQVVYDFTDQASREASVDVVGAQASPCLLKGQRFICDPQSEWNWAGPILAEVEHLPYRCFYAHPVEGQIKKVTFAAAKLGRELIVYMGIDNFEHRKSGKAPVNLNVLIDDRVVGEFTHQNDWPWWPQRINTSASDGEQHQVTFEITAPQTFLRTFCFHAQARR